MQNRPLLWYLVYVILWPISAIRFALSSKGHPMSKTAFADFSASTSIFARLLGLVDELLMKSAKISQRNGDLPYFGL